MTAVANTGHQPDVRVERHRRELGKPRHNLGCVLLHMMRPRSVTSPSIERVNVADGGQQRGVVSNLRYQFWGMGHALRCMRIDASLELALNQESHLNLAVLRSPHALDRIDLQ